MVPIIQIFDSWAGLIDEKKRIIYLPTDKEIVEYTKSLNVEVICFQNINL